jgi:hypothetical protein
MAKLVLLDTTRTGKQSQDLEKNLRRLVVGQDEAILEIVAAYQSHVTGCPQAALRSETFCSSDRRARARLASWKRQRSACWAIRAP